jgi:hypothetical protein
VKLKIGFWRWLGHGIHSLPKTCVQIGKGLTEPFLEGAYGTIIMVLGSLAVGSLIDPLLVLVPIPIGFLIVLHGLYRFEEDC